MYLEIIPDASQSLTRLRDYLYHYYKPSQNINIVVPSKFKKQVSFLLSKENIKNIFISERPLIREFDYVIFYQFDFLETIAINYNSIYLTSLRYSRRIKDINNWLSGKTSDILLSLIAISSNNLVV